MLKITNLSSLHTVKPPHPMWNWLDSNKICGKGEEKICAGSDSLHAEMIYAKSLAAALFTFGNARLEISKAKQKGQQTTVSGACCGTLVFFFFLLLLFSLSDTCSASSAPALFPLTSKTRPFRLNEGAHQRCWMHPLLLVNNTYLAGRPNGLFFAFKSPPPPLFTWLVSPAGSSSHDIMVMASLAFAAEERFKPAHIHKTKPHFSFTHLASPSSVIAVNALWQSVFSLLSLWLLPLWTLLSIDTLVFFLQSIYIFSIWKWQEETLLYNKGEIVFMRALPWCEEQSLLGKKTHKKNLKTMQLRLLWLM